MRFPLRRRHFVLRAATAAGGVGRRRRGRGTWDGGDSGRLRRVGFWHSRCGVGCLGGWDAAAERPAGDRPAGGAEEAEPGHGRQQERPDGAAQEGEAARRPGVEQEVGARPRAGLSPRFPDLLPPLPPCDGPRPELAGTRGPGCVTLVRHRPSLCLAFDPPCNQCPRVPKARLDSHRLAPALVPGPGWRLGSVTLDRCLLLPCASVSPPGERMTEEPLRCCRRGSCAGSYSRVFARRSCARWLFFQGRPLAGGRLVVFPGLLEMFPPTSFVRCCSVSPLLRLCTTPARVYPNPDWGGGGRLPNQNRLLAGLEFTIEFPVLSSPPPPVPPLLNATPTFTEGVSSAGSLLVTLKRKVGRFLGPV